MREWCEHCRDHFDVDHYSDDEDGGHMVGAAFGPTGADMEEIRMLRASQAAWIVEREQAVQALRRLCADWGDNDWDEKLSLADVIEKHLARYLYDMVRHIKHVDLPQDPPTTD